MNKQDLCQKLSEIGAIQRGQFTLKSGKTSSIYIDLRRIISYPALLKAVAAHIWQTVSNEQFDLICGVPYTALPIATCLACLLYTSPSPRDRTRSRMPSSA